MSSVLGYGRRILAARISLTVGHVEMDGIALLDIIRRFISHLCYVTCVGYVVGVCFIQLWDGGYRTIQAVVGWNVSYRVRCEMQSSNSIP